MQHNHARRTGRYMPGSLSRATADYTHRLTATSIEHGAEHLENTTRLALVSRAMGAEAYRSMYETMMQNTSSAWEMMSFYRLNIGKTSDRLDDFTEQNEYERLKYLHESYELESGNTVTIRLADTNDREGMFDLYKSMSSADMQMRFFGQVSEMSLRKAAYISDEDPEHFTDLVAVIDDKIVGIAGYSAEGGIADPHILVGSDARHTKVDDDHFSIARHLMGRNLRMAAHDSSVKSIVVEVLARNRPMNGLLEHVIEDNADVMRIEKSISDDGVRETVITPIDNLAA